MAGMTDWSGTAGHDLSEEASCDRDGRRWTHVCSRCGIRLRVERLANGTVAIPVYSRTPIDCDKQVVDSVMRD